MCGGVFKLKIKIRMRKAEADAFLAAAADDLSKRLKTDWDWHRDPKGEIWKKLGEKYACHLQADITACCHNSRKNKILMSQSKERGTPDYPLYLWIHGPPKLVDLMAKMFDT